MDKPPKPLAINERLRAQADLLGDFIEECIECASGKDSDSVKIMLEAADLIESQSQEIARLSAIEQRVKYEIAEGSPAFAPYLQALLTPEAPQ